MTERPELLTEGSTVSAAARIVEWLRPALEGATPDRVQKVERHIGSFSTPKEVKHHLSAREGCIRIAALKVSDITSRHGLTGTVTWAAYVMVTDSFGYPRSDRCQVIAGRLCRRLTERGAHVGMGAERAAENVRADNLYSGSLDELGVTMWTVTWDQPFRLDDVVDLNELDDFLRLGATVVHGSEAQNDVINVRED